MLIQQGDVLLFRVGELPEGVKKLNHCVVAEGEATGHKHQIVDGVLFADDKDNMFVSVENDTPGVLSHEEHAPVKIPQGIWKIKKVLEYDHFAEEAKEVRD